jgi:hypothetical protein
MCKKENVTAKGEMSIRHTVNFEDIHEFNEVIRNRSPRQTENLAMFIVTKTV